MNIIHKLLLLLSLSMTPAVTVSAQSVNNEFDTFQTIDKYLADFDYLNSRSMRNSTGTFDSISVYNVNYNGGAFRFYAFPIFYELDFSISLTPVVEYYRNDNYQFVVAPYSNNERPIEIEVLNYIGTETEICFLAIDTIGMFQVIEHDKEIESNSISIYNSFYNFFTGFFPNEVVNEYHGIFTFIVVGFLLFLVFGFVFFLFRVIRRLVGFK